MIDSKEWVDWDTQKRERREKYKRFLNWLEEVDPVAMRELNRFNRVKFNNRVIFRSSHGYRQWLIKYYKGEAALVIVPTEHIQELVPEWNSYSTTDRLNFLISQQMHVLSTVDVGKAFSRIYEEIDPGDIVSPQTVVPTSNGDIYLEMTLTGSLIAFWDPCVPE